MHERADGQVPLLVALRAAARLMEMKLVSAPKDHVGILLWNTVRFCSNLGGVTHGHRDPGRIPAPHY